MRETRRAFLWLAVAAGSGLVVLPAEAQQQENQNLGMPKRPEPGDPQQQDKNGTPADPRTAKRTMTLQNEKEFRAGVEKLYQMTGELKDEVDKTATTDVLSVRMYKKMEEIEKLAKQLKGKVKG